MKKSKVIKLSVNLPAGVVDVLRTLAEKRGVTMTRILSHAVITEKFIDDVNEKNGKILVEDKRGRIRQLVFR